MDESVTYADLQFVTSPSQQPADSHKKITEEHSDNTYANVETNVPRLPQPSHEHKQGNSCSRSYLIIALIVTCLILIIATIGLAIKYVEISRELQDNIWKAQNSSTTMARSDRDNYLQRIQDLQNETEQCKKSEKDLRTALRLANEKYAPCQNKDLCPCGWKLINGKCIFFSECMNSWAASFEDCKNKNSTLTIRPQVPVLQTFFENEQNGYWVGLRTIYDTARRHWRWQWLDGSFQGSFGEQGHCGFIQNEGGLFISNCMDAKHWICEKEPALNSPKMHL